MKTSWRSALSRPPRTDLRPCPAVCTGLALVVSLALLMLLRWTSMSDAAPEDKVAQRFDFGTAATEPGMIAIGPELRYSPRLGYGWLDTTGLLARDRTRPDALRRDFVYGQSAHTFRVGGLQPGRYRLTIICGDMEFGNHVTQVKVGGNALSLPVLQADVAEFVTLTVTVTVALDTLDISFNSPEHNWIVNALLVEPTAAEGALKVERQQFPPPVSPAVSPGPMKSTWGPVLSWPDPTKALLAQFRAASAKAPLAKAPSAKASSAKAPVAWQPTGLTRADYLKLMAGEVDFWKGHQDAKGAIIDPYRQVEWQYSTPAFAHAAAALVVWAGRRDLIEPAAKALDWAAHGLSTRQAASHHEDFFAPMLAHAMPLLKPYVTPERAARWEEDIRSFDPFKTYRAAPGANNWNVVSLSGEALFQQLGLRDGDNKWVEASLAAQGQHFGSPYGLYLEGPMPYDHFPRLWAADMIAHGYAGPYHAELAEVLRRAAITSLFMQSPWGELPAGGRSAQHQWNEAEQCVTYEIYAAQALRDGDPILAGIYKRAAHLALASMRRWVRPSGEMQIVKNWVDPAQSHAFEGYSAHSQYNLLPMSMLAIAYHQSATTDGVPEQPAPADVGGYVLEIRPLHKVFANAGGAYIEIDTSADHHYDATGLIRVQFRGLAPQLGPSDSIIEHPAYHRPAASQTPATTGVGVAWTDPAGTWHRLGELSAADITAWTLSNAQATPQNVSFDLSYEGKLFGATRIVEHYTVTPGRVELTTSLDGYTGPLRYMWPVLADDGRTKSVIKVSNGTVSASQDGGRTAATWTPVGAASVQVEAPLYPNHNGWARLAVAAYPQGGKITLILAPQMAP